MASKISVFCVAFLAVVLMCSAGVPQKREVNDDVVSDANQALDKLFEDLNAGIKKLANDGVNVTNIMQNLSSKANELGNTIKELGQDIGQKVQEAAQKQGLTQ